jgi:hypothetical protein
MNAKAFDKVMTLRCAADFGVNVTCIDRGVMIDIRLLDTVRRCALAVLKRVGLG